MAWYYVDGQERVGPVAEADFEGLVAAGQVTATTLVWREGMADWVTYRQALAAQSTAGGLGQAAAPAVAFCSQCGQRHNLDNLITYEGVQVCAACKPAFFQRIHEGQSPLAATDFRYAGFWIRLVAVLLDGLIVQIVNLPLRLLAAGDSSIELLSWPITILYYTVFVGMYGGTPGKLILGLRVVVSDGTKVSYLRAFGRYWAYMLSMLTLGIGYIIAGFDSQKRALHDHICNTRVVWKR